MPLPIIPPNWIVRGDLLDIDPSIAEEDDLDVLDEDILQIVDATGTFTLDVGWYPAANRDGRFLCRAVSSDQWEDPLEEFKSQSCADVFQWLQGWIGEIQTRLGQADVISEEVIATDVVDAEIVKAAVPADASQPQNVVLPFVPPVRLKRTGQDLPHAA